MVRVVGLEPTHTCVREILSLVRLPFRHTRAPVLVAWQDRSVNRPTGVRRPPRVALKRRSGQEYLVFSAEVLVQLWLTFRHAGVSAPMLVGNRCRASTA